MKYSYVAMTTRVSSLQDPFTDELAWAELCEAGFINEVWLTVNYQIKERNLQRCGHTETHEEITDNIYYS